MISHGYGKSSVLQICANDQLAEKVQASPGVAPLTLHDGQRVWKGFDWDALDRLHRKSLIANPVNKAKSVVHTDEGLRRSEALVAALFGKARDA
jgi:hypothetical protein